MDTVARWHGLDFRRTERAQFRDLQFIHPNLANRRQHDSRFAFAFSFRVHPLWAERSVLLLPAGRSRPWALIGRWPRVLHRVVFNKWSRTYRALHTLNGYLGCRSRFS